jgi:hypothetical protein
MLAGCGTTYQANGLTGGFSSMQLDTNVWQVSFKGNAFTSRERVRDFGLLRAAELTLQNGYNYFLIMSEDDYTKTDTTQNQSLKTNMYCNDTGSGDMNCHGKTTGGGSTTYTKHSVERLVVMYIDRPDEGVPYNAQLVYEQLRAKYDIDE